MRWSVLHRRCFLAPIALFGAVVGCAPLSSPQSLGSYPRPSPPAPVIQQANFTQPKPESDEKPLSKLEELGLAELTELTLARNPRLAKVGWAVEAARGRAVQAGLYPNPIVNITGDEINDKQGRGGIWGAPYITQEFVTAGKLNLSQAAANKEVDAATLNVVAERFTVLTEVRQAYFDLLTLQRRADALAVLVDLSDKAVATAEKLLKAKQAAPLDVVQLEYERERYRAELEAAERALPAARRKLAATVGAPDLPAARLAGSLEPVPPEYDLDRLRAYLFEIHPEVRAAQLAVDRARLLVRKAEADAIPNVTGGAGYTWQGQNKSHDWAIGLTVPMPLWNRNQGNIRAAQAQYGEAVNEVGRVQNDLASRLATAYATYIAARARVERYKATIIPKARESYKFVEQAQKAGEFDLLKLVTAQRAVADVNLELVKSQGEMWRAAAEIAGYLLEDNWPLMPPSMTPPMFPPER